MAYISPAGRINSRFAHPTASTHAGPQLLRPKLLRFAQPSSTPTVAGTPGRSSWAGAGKHRKRSDRLFSCRLLLPNVQQFHRHTDAQP
jgi:hypothetical protein